MPMLSNCFPIDILLGGINQFFIHAALSSSFLLVFARIHDLHDDITVYLKKYIAHQFLMCRLDNALYLDGTLKPLNSDPDINNVVSLLFKTKK